MHILDGKLLRDEIREKLKKEIAGFEKKPHLSIIQVGDREESNAYIGSKKRFGETLGIEVEHIKFQENVEESEVIKKIESLNGDKKVNGILVQLPLSKHLDSGKIMDAILPSKDVDGLGSVNVKKLWEGREDAFIPATTKGILMLLEQNKIEIEGQNVLIIGRSSLVGKPTALAFLMKDATVTIAHKKTRDLEKHAKAADIIVVAIGKPKFLTKNYVCAGQVIIDVGINPIEKAREKDSEMALQDEIPNKTLVGDVDFEAVKDIVSAITPVPGGVGPMTVASLFVNVVEAYRRSITRNV